MNLNDQIQFTRTRYEKLRELARLKASIEQIEAQLVAMSIPADKPLKTIFRTVCNHYTIAPSLILSRCREDWIVIPRQAVMYLVRVILRTDIRSIGKVFQRDHTLVSYSCKAILDRREVDKAFRHEINALEEECRLALNPKNEAAVE